MYLLYLRLNLVPHFIPRSDLRPAFIIDIIVLVCFIVMFRFGYMGQFSQLRPAGPHMVPQPTPMMQAPMGPMVTMATPQQMMQIPQQTPMMQFAQPTPMMQFAQPTPQQVMHIVLMAPGNLYNTLGNTVGMYLYSVFSFEHAHT